jgi:hypothetical protein
LVGLDHGNPMPVLHRSDGKTDSERTLSAAALLSGQYDSAHSALPFTGKQTKLPPKVKPMSMPQAALWTTHITRPF